MNIHAVSLRSV